MASDIFFLAQRIAKGGAAAKPHVTKAELYQALQAGAAKIQKAGETDAQAFARFATEHPDGEDRPRVSIAPQSGKRQRSRVSCLGHCPEDSRCQRCH